MHINYQTADFRCNAKLFADDTALFTVDEDSNTAANDMNHNLMLIRQLAYD